MQRITISIEDGLAETFDQMIADRAYDSRSEAVRDLVRDALDRWRVETGSARHCVANFSYVYDRRLRSLAERLSGIEHEHHDLVVSSSTVRLDHYHSLVSVLLKGSTTKVRPLIETMGAQRGVRSATVNLVAVETGDEHDRPGAHHHGHEHLSPYDG